MHIITRFLPLLLLFLHKYGILPLQCYRIVIKFVSPKHRITMNVKLTGIMIALLVISSSAFVTITGQNTTAKQVVNPSDNKKLSDYLPKVATPAYAPVTASTKQDSVVTHNNDLRSPTPTPVIQDIGALTSEINRIQNQMVQQMQSCVQLARQAQNEIGSLKSQERQLQEAINAANRDINKMNTNTDVARKEKFERQQRRDQLQFQRNQLNNRISQTRQSFYRNKSECQNSVYRLQSQKRILENQLSTAFNRSVTVNF